MNKLERLKFRYSLWWEYLKRSDIYKEFCGSRNSEEELSDYFDEETYQLFKNKWEVNPLIYYDIFHEFGNVHINQFDSWWENKKEGILSIMNKTIVDIREDMKFLTYMSHKFFYKMQFNHGKRRFSDQDFADMILFIKNHIFINDGNFLFLKVNIEGAADAEILARRITQLKTKHKIKKPDKADNQKVREELFKYLNVYDLRQQGLSYPDIIKKIGTPSERSKLDKIDLIREYRRYNQKAKKIIKNVEKNIFPGKY